MKTTFTNSLTKLGTTLLKTTGIFIMSTIVNQELRNSTKTTLETLTQQIRIAKHYKLFSH
jgi:glutamine cyclotransferase